MQEFTPMTTNPQVGAGQIAWRVDQLERRMSRLEETDQVRTEILARMDERQTTLAEDVKLLSRDMAGLKRSLYMLLFALALAVVSTGIDIAVRVATN
jgi:hypothetical protein